jgi:hypothetical protein
VVCVASELCLRARQEMMQIGVGKVIYVGGALNVRMNIEG